ncbi:MULTISPECIES: MaoC family dehydratase [unclassified Bradyrhizobium]|uniref:MaoC family dehydratase n=1 Tax=unclassified Bradyrhizobium TaxID=2631580 RepID=UPI001FF7679E|nr:MULTISPECIES: MaoC family dehydratase [unclassified Bradyrhizobium]MCK1348702.1 MaoC family dehydratase [Bradyrhizobium sp. CW11]MCK1700410.1 MaoC family dehydratase [Bradyrhizobium sp. 146]
MTPNALNVTFEESAVGDTFSGRLSVNLWHLMTGAALYGDMSANHVDVEHSTKNRFGGRVIHGFTIAGMMSGLVTRRYNWALEGLLESNTRFLAPIFVDNNLDVRWQVIAKTPKPSFGGGLMDLGGAAWVGRERRKVVQMTIKIGLSNYRGPEIESNGSSTPPL